MNVSKPLSRKKFTVGQNETVVKSRLSKQLRQNKENGQRPASTQSFKSAFNRFDKDATLPTKRLVSEHNQKSVRIECNEVEDMAYPKNVKIWRPNDNSKTSTFAA